MRGLWLAVLAVAVLVFYWLQREPPAERSPATERGAVGQGAPQTPNVPSPPAGSSAPRGPGSDGGRPAEAGQKQALEDLLRALADPVERGPCSLFLRVVSEDAGRPVRTEVYLYRLDAPGNEHWSEGDRLKATVMVEREGTRIEELPEGRYRVYSMQQRKQSEDPPAFRVAGELTKHTVRIPLPRRYRVYVMVYDERGRILRDAERRDVGYGKSSTQKEPTWLRKRRFRSPDGILGPLSATRPRSLERVRR